MNARTDVEQIQILFSNNYEICGDFNAGLNVKPCFRLRLIAFTIKFMMILMPD
jgi:hypothetical protein